MDSQTKTKAVNLEDLQISVREVFNKCFGNSGTCTTAAATPAKEVTLGTIFSLVTGCALLVKFTHGITSENSTLAVTHTVNGSSVTETAKPIYLNGTALAPRVIPEGAILILRYNGSQYDIIGGGGQASDAYTKAQTNALLNAKVDKVTGKGLSTNDYTTNEKNKLAGIAEGAEVNVQSDWNATSGDAFIKNKPTIPAAAANGTYTVKTLVGSTTTNVSDFTANQSSADDVTFVQGSNVTITPDTTNRRITIAAKDTTYSSKAAASGGTDVSLVTTGEKYTWNGKQAAASFTQVSGKTYYALTL